LHVKKLLKKPFDTVKVIYVEKVFLAFWAGDLRGPPQGGKILKINEYVLNTLLFALKK